ncbi:DUF481 domain-containing protein [Ferrimonas lipolytica]|uniref:DUF481 domain-containing protein n=1 Tax=Ferrimonas lipolytica TaxID=2724191 RepID=A0A6H1UEF0_9GAMM|nr:DUF481 domain-containing protein [Ferrimonas lipolytica]QIZ77461.1 DUF481 domain-containing protein [Ferrimonas lipolytica]
MKRTLIAVFLCVPAIAVAEYSAEAELGATMTSGNTESTSILAKYNSEHKLGDWTNHYKLEALYSEDDDERSAERYRGEVQTDYPASGKHYFFAVLNAETDKFSGYEYVVTGAAGYGNRFIEEEDMTLLFEVGPGYSYKKIDEDLVVDKDNESDVIVRAKTEFWWKFSDNAEFKQTLGSDIAFDGATISFSESSLVANLVGELAMKLSYNIKHNSDPGGDTDSTDTILAATLLYKF